MSEPIELSVIVPTWNRAESLEKFLRSLAGQTAVPGVRWELLAVDNNSTDGTPQVLKRWQGRLPQLRYIFESRQGQAFARNRGLEEARGRIVAFLDDDVVVEPQWMRSVLDAFSKRGCDVLQGRIRLRFPDRRPPWLSDKGAESLACADYGEAAGPLERYLVGANMAFRREVFDRFGRFNTALGPGRCGYNDDTEFSRRIRGKGLLEWYEPSASVWHVVPPVRLRKGYLIGRSFRQGISDAVMKPIPERGLRRFRLLLYHLKGGLQHCVEGGLHRTAEEFDQGMEAYRKWGYVWGHLKRPVLGQRGSACGS